MNLDSSYYAQGRSIVTSSYADINKKNKKKNSVRKVGKLTLVKNKQHTKSETFILKPFNMSKGRIADLSSEGDTEEGISSMMTPFIAYRPKTINM
jgi:hypothetical protein